MKSACIIKGNKYGFQIVLDRDLAFDQLVGEVEKRFRASGAFFDRNKPVAVSFSGRDLKEEEQDILVDTIQGASDLVVSYVIDGARAHETRYARALSEWEPTEKPVSPSSGSEEPAAEEDAGSDPGPERKKPERDEKEEGFGIIRRILAGEKVQNGEAEDPASSGAAASEPGQASGLTGPVFPEDEVGKHGQFYRGILRSGQKIEVDGSFVILGDVNPGAQIIAGGNVVILGSLKGTVYAGYPTDRNAIVAALNMEPMQIQIGDFIARSADADPRRGKKTARRKKQSDLEPRMAFVDDGNICIEKIDRKLISEISGRSQQE